MSDDGVRLPEYKSLNQLADNATKNHSDLLGKIVPGTVVSFDGVFAVVNIEISSQNNYPQLKVPVLCSEYIRLPIQKGCRGFLIPLSVSIDHICGLGQTAPGNAPTLNMSNMAFLPIASHTQQAFKDTETLYLYGEKKGVKIQTKNGSTFIHAHGKTIKIEGETISIRGDASLIGNLNIVGDVTITGKLTINGIEFPNHTHSDGDMGGPTGGVIL